MDGSHDFIGGPGEEDGYCRIEGGLVSGGSEFRVGSDGISAGLGVDGVSAGLAMGTGSHADSSSDTGFAIGGSLGSFGGAGETGWSDDDGDGVRELTVAGGLELLGGVGVSVTSEVPDLMWQAAQDWWEGA